MYSTIEKSWIGLFLPKMSFLGLWNLVSINSKFFLLLLFHSLDILWELIGYFTNYMEMLMVTPAKVEAWFVA